MGISDRTYSVLIVSASKQFSDAALSMLSSSRYDPVRSVSNISAARRLILERSFDFILINSPLPDETGTRFAVDVSSSESSVVLLFVPSELYDDVFERAAGHGVFCVAKPVSRSSFSLALGWLCSARERLRKTEKKTLSIEEKMEEIRLVNRAKWLLISELKMDEAAAHRYIEKQAMDRCTSKSEIARGVIRMYSSK